MRLDGLNEAAATPSAAALEDARFGFARAHPHRSARRVLYITQILAIAALITALVFAAQIAPRETFASLHIIALIIFAAAILVRLVAAASLDPLLSRLADQADMPIYTILCPLYREANVTPDLVAALSKLDYPGMVYQSNRQRRRTLNRPISGPWPKSAQSQRSPQSASS